MESELVSYQRVALVWAALSFPSDPKKSYSAKEICILCQRASNAMKIPIEISLKQVKEILSIAINHGCVAEGITGSSDDDWTYDIQVCAGICIPEEAFNPAKIYRDKI